MEGQLRVSNTRPARIYGRATSVTLEETFWTALKEIAEARRMSPNQLIEDISSSRWYRGNLSGALREFTLDAYRTQARLATRSRNIRDDDQTAAA
jgi:predicted DNA-binding ribbon-helix-helix protein